MTNPDRVTGALLGLAVGDALGSPLVMMTPMQVQIRHGTARELSGGGWLGLRPGAWSHHTALALELARSLVERGAFDAEDVAGRYAKWYGGGRKGPRGILRTSLALLAEGVPAADAAARAHELSGEDIAGNETLVRAVPPALALGGEEERLVDAVTREARITHRDDRAAAGSASLALVLSRLVAGGTRREAWDFATGVMERHPQGLPDVLPDLRAVQESALRGRPTVEDSLEVACYFGLRAAGFEEALVRTANLGGASDVTTALAGALAGARFGAAAIPKRWLDHLRDRKAIAELAGALRAVGEKFDQERPGA